MRLPRGVYLGENVKQISASRVCFTVSRYPGLSRSKRHVHEDPGLFVVVSGQYREERDVGSLEQPPFTLTMHDDIYPHESQIGPAGALGLNISFDRGWFESERLAFRGFYLDRPETRRHILRLIAGIASNNVAETENLAVDLVGLVATFGEARPSRACIQTARERVEGQFREQLRISGIAKEMGIHPAHLSRAFRVQYGCSITEYLKTLRLSEAIRLFLTGSAMGEAAVQAGFYDQSQLCHAFRSDLGVRPTSLKKLQSTSVSERRSRRN